MPKSDLDKPKLMLEFCDNERTLFNYMTTKITNLQYEKIADC
jgi:hypothetical protein